MAFIPFTAADVILGAATIRQNRQVGHRGGFEFQKDSTSGGGIIAQISGKSGEEVTSLTSGDLAGLLALNTSTFCSAGLPLLSSTITVPFKDRSQAALFAGSSAHNALGGTNALVIPTSIEATQDENATCAYEIHWISSDGKTSGVSGTAGNSLSSQSLNAVYTLGPAYINAAQIEGVQSIKVTPGFTLVKAKSDGKGLPVWISVQQIEPMVEITTNYLTGVATTVDVVTSMSSANVYFRKRADSGVYTADATAEHIKMTFAAGVTDTNSVEVSDNNNGTVTITLHGKTLTCSVVSAIP